MVLVWSGMEERDEETRPAASRKEGNRGMVVDEDIWDADGDVGIDVEGEDEQDVGQGEEEEIVYLDWDVDVDVALVRDEEFSSNKGTWLPFRRHPILET